MLPTSYLRIYQRLDSFPASERTRWTSYLSGGKSHSEGDPYRHVAFSDHPMGILHPSTADHAFTKQVDEVHYVCPWRTKLRVLVGLLSARNALPFEIADAFVPEEAAFQAAEQLEEIHEHQGDLKSHITTSTWHVPLRWFIAFDGEERKVTRDERGDIKVSYLTRLGAAGERTRRALSVLMESGMAPSVIDPIEEMLEWFVDFPEDSLLELDYGTVGRLFAPEELVLDNSSAEIWHVLTALEEGDFDESGRLYTELANWWGKARAVQSAN